MACCLSQVLVPQQVPQPSASTSASTSANIQYLSAFITPAQPGQPLPATLSTEILNAPGLLLTLVLQLCSLFPEVCSCFMSVYNGHTSMDTILRPSCMHWYPCIFHTTVRLVISRNLLMPQSASCSPTTQGSVLAYANQKFICYPVSYNYINSPTRSPNLQWGIFASLSFLGYCNL